jgi:hypothetical protein
MRSATLIQIRVVFHCCPSFALELGEMVGWHLSSDNVWCQHVEMVRALSLSAEV